MQVKVRGRNGTGSTSAVDAWAKNIAKTLITTAVKFGYSSSAAADAYFVSKGTVTMTKAGPAVFTLATHTLVTGEHVKITTDGALYTGLVAGATYYARRIDADTFTLAPTAADAIAGTNLIETTGTESGTHTLYIPGTGAQTIRSTVLDEAGNVKSEVITLNGQTKVESSIPLALRVLSMEVLTTGSGGVSAGDIYAYDTADTLTSGVPDTAAKTFGEIATGRTEDEGGHFTIPKGHVGRIAKFSGSFPDITTTAKYGYIELQYKPYLGTLWKRYAILGVSSASQMSASFSEALPETIPELSDIRIQYRQSATCEVSALVEIDLTLK